jgi:excisionase family DNA binding protein
LYRLLKAGEIPGAFKMGRVWRLDLNELERFLEAKGRDE